MTLLTFVDRLLIELLATTSAVGIYSSNYSLVQTGLPLVLAPIIQTAHPIIMNEWNGNNHTHISSLIRKYSRYYLILGVGATIFVGIISRPLSVLVLSDSYHSGYTLIPIIAAALLLWNFGMLGHKGLELKDLTALMTGGILSAVVSNIILNYLLIPIYGYTGAAVATLGSSAVYVGFA
jgi:O-antigen/teichoic acid export membrane protein